MSLGSSGSASIFYRRRATCTSTVRVVGNLTQFAKSLSTAEDVLDQKARLQQGWVATPAFLATGTATLATAVQAKPDQSAAAAAHSFLTLAQDRLNSYRQARRAEKRAKDAADVGKLAYTTYCDVLKTGS